jgi:hypothetical protein
MTKFITLPRRYVLYGTLTLVIALAGVAGISIWKSAKQIQ